MRDALPTASDHTADSRIPFLAILPDQTLDVALLEKSAVDSPPQGQPPARNHHSTANMHLPRWLTIPGHGTSHAQPQPEPFRSPSQQLQQHGMAPLPLARCHEFSGIPESLVWSIALLDQQHPHCVHAKLSSSSRLASLFRLAATRSIDCQASLGPSAAAVTRSATRWWSARSQDLPYPAPARDSAFPEGISRDPAGLRYQPSDQPAGAAASRAAVAPTAAAHPGTRHLTDSPHACVHAQPQRCQHDPQGLQAAALYRTATPERVPVFIDSAASGQGSRGGSSSSLRLSGRLGSVGRLGSHASRGSGPDGHGHTYQRLSEVVVA